MAATVQHVFTSPIADGTNTQLVRPSNWNSGHLVTMNAVGSEISGAFNNGGGVTFGLETNGFITASAPAGGGGLTNIKVSAGTLSAHRSDMSFNNSNGVSFGLDTNGIITATVGTNYQSQGAYLTTAAQSDHSHGNPTLALTNLSGTTASNSGGFTLSLSAALGGGAGDGYNILAAGTQTAGTAASVLFNNANGITFGMSNSSVITASHNGLTTAPAIATNVWDIGSAGSTGVVTRYAPEDHVHAGVRVFAAGSTTGNTAGNTMQKHGDWVIAGSNNITINGSTGAGGVHTAWVSGPSLTQYLTTARASNDAVGLNTALTAGPLAWTVNSAGLSLNAGSAAGTTTGFAGNLISGSMTHNTAGLNVSLNHPAWLTTAAQSGHSHGNPTLALTNLAGTTASASNGFTLSLSATAQSAQPVAASGSNGSFAFSTLSFGALNGLTFYTSNGSIVASYTDAGAGGGVNFSAGTQSSALAAVTFADGGGVSFGLNAGTITASVNAGGGGNTASTYIPYYPASTAVQTMGAQGVTSASAFFFPISIVHPVKFNQIEQLMTASWVSSATAATGQQTVTHHFGIFTNNAGTLSVMSSSSYSFAITNNTGSATLSYPASYGTAGGYTYTTVPTTGSAQAQSLFGTAGNRILTLGFGNTMSLSQGLYFLGIHQRQSSAGFNVGMNFALAGNVMAAQQNAGPMNASTANYTGTANTAFKFPFGVATSTGSAGYGGSRLPDAVNITALGVTATVMPMMTLISR